MRGFSYLIGDVESCDQRWLLHTKTVRLNSLKEFPLSLWLMEDVTNVSYLCDGYGADLQTKKNAYSIRLVTEKEKLLSTSALIPKNSIKVNEKQYIIVYVKMGFQRSISIPTFGKSGYVMLKKTEMVFEHDLIKAELVRLLKDAFSHYASRISDPKFDVEINGKSLSFLSDIEELNGTHHTLVYSILAVMNN